jgi:hypothetical protein
MVRFYVSSSARLESGHSKLGGGPLEDDSRAPGWPLWKWSNSFTRRIIDSFSAAALVEFLPSNRRRKRRAYFFPRPRYSRYRLFHRWTTPFHPRKQSNLRFILK